MSTEVRQRTTSRDAHAGHRLEPAQLVWRRALVFADEPGRRDRFVLALALLRAANHGPATLLHALNLGRTHVRATPGDISAGRGVAILEDAITFLGVMPRVGDIAAARERRRVPC